MPPTPDFPPPESWSLIREWVGAIITGMISFLVGALLMVRGDKNPIVPMSPEQIKSHLRINELEMKEELREEFYKALREISEHNKEELKELRSEILEIVRDNRGKR